MRLIFFMVLLTICGAPAFAQAPAGAHLPEALNDLLAAAHASGDEDDFSDAVRLIALTEAPEDIAGAASAISPERGAQVRSQLGLPASGPQEPQTDLAAAPEETGTGGPAAEAPSGAARMFSRAAPLAAARALASGQSEAWEGRAELGVRFDSGNSDRQDYTIGLGVKRALAVWGFEGALSYAYSEVDGAIGRDEFTAQARGEREAGERWTLFVRGEYEQDALDGYDWTAFAAAGMGYRVLDRPERAWVLRAGPGARFLQDAAGQTTTDPALELSSDFEWQISQPVRFSADTSVLVSQNARAQQEFRLDTTLGELWSLALSYRYTYEFEPEPGFENEDSRTDISIVRLF